MSIKKLFTKLNALHPISDQLKSALTRMVVPVVFPKNHILLEPPKIADHAYFIASGFAVSYVYFNDRKCINWIWSNDDIVFSPRSLIQQEPSKEFMEVMLPSELLCISRDNIFRLFDLHPEANALYRFVVNDYFEWSCRYIVELKTLDTVERYGRLLERVPGVEQILSQEQIASYIGITPQSLSRMKKRSIWE